MSDPTPTFAYVEPPAGDTQTLPPSPGPVGIAVGSPTVPGYDIEAELGRGGMGVVYRARQTRLNRVVALKMVLAGGHASPQERTRFLAEAEAVAAVQHSGIVQVYEFGTCGEQPYFALEYCPGGSLAAKLAGTPLPPAEAAGLVERISRAVQAAHEKGIVHRDLKPDNVLFGADGTPKVTDFGLARKVESDSGLTRTGAIMGTPSYMAPEQAAAKKDIGPAADVWALGAILYECLTGRPPFRAATALDTIVQVATDEPVLPRKLVPGIPRDVETICLKCLQKEPDKRYITAAALADDLKRYLAGDPIEARPTTLGERTWKWVRKRPSLAALILVSVAAPLLVAAVVGTGLTIFIARLGTKNEELEQERNAAVRAREAAERAGAEADTQRAKAQARLGKAVEAVEKVLRRAGGEKWARDPVLAAERRRILEDIVVFYEGFTDEDAKDPLVRRETARAFYQIADVYRLIAEYQKAQTAFSRAESLQAGLAAEFPEEIRYSDELARTLLDIGHLAASTGDFVAAQKTYARAVERARKAVDRRPSDDGFRRTLVECLCSYGYSFLIVPNAGSKSGAAFQEAVSWAEGLLRPDAPFPNRVVAAYALISSDHPVVFGRQRNSPGANFRRGANFLAEMTPDPDAPAKYRDLYDLTTVMARFYDALEFLRSGQDDSTLGTGQSAAGMLRKLRKAADGIDRLLAVYPKAFQYRMYKLQILMVEAAILSSVGKEDEQRKRVAELFAVEDAILRDTPTMTMVRSITYPLHCTDLLTRASRAELAGFDADVDRLLNTPGARPGDRYNLACALSIASEAGSTSEREGRAAKAVRLLTELLDGEFYKGETNASHVDKDSDLDPLRGRSDFKAFRAKMPAAGK